MSNPKFKREDIGKEVTIDKGIKGVIREVDEVDEHVLVYFHGLNSEIALDGEQMNWVDLIDGET
jgi:hypothetical protein